MISVAAAQQILNASGKEYTEAEAAAVLDFINKLAETFVKSHPVEKQSSITNDTTNNDSTGIDIRASEAA